MSVNLEEFLTELIDRLQKDNLSSDMTKMLTDMFLLNELEKVGRTPNTIVNSENNMKYYIMGWYIYNNLNIEKDKSPTM